MMSEEEAGTLRALAAEAKALAQDVTAKHALPEAGTLLTIAMARVMAKSPLGDHPLLLRRISGSVLDLAQHYREHPDE